MLSMPSDAIHRHRPVRRATARAGGLLCEMPAFSKHPHEHECGALRRCNEDSMEITAQLVKELRERSGAGIMECKKALTQNDGDIDVAIEWLRKQGLAKADKKASRVAAEGRVVLAQDAGK